MKVFSRLNWFSTTRESVPDSLKEEPDTLPLGSIAADIEAFHWETLLDDMDRFSRSFPPGNTK
jgi:hypothetical protein